MILRRVHLFVITAFALLVVFCGTATAAKVCFECHARATFQKKFVHQPVAGDKCISCHNPHAAKHAGLLQKEVSGLCYSCHGEKEESFSKGVIHDPVRQGDCTACHDPHASASRGLMKGKYADSCFTCHETLSRNFKYNHKPFANGQCDACHSPHQANNYQLLTMSAANICQKCHSGNETEQAHRNYPVAIKGCLTCHNPHGSDNRAIIRNVRHAPFIKDCKICHKGGSAPISQDVCLKCHEEVKESLMTTHNHLTDNGGNSCISCHSPHAGNTKQLLQARPLLLCRNCHDDTFKRHEQSLFIHKVTANDCQKCHAVHGSNQVAMLAGDGNSICLACHPNQGQFSHPVGAKVIDPRNNQQATCLSCHNPHGTDFKGQLVLSGQEDLCVQCHHM